jgi:hypothetical protein
VGASRLHLSLFTPALIQPAVPSLSLHVPLENLLKDNGEPQRASDQEMNTLFGWKCKHCGWFSRRGMRSLASRIWWWLIQSICEGNKNTEHRSREQR